MGEMGEEKSGEDRSSEVDPRSSYSLVFYIFVCERRPQNRLEQPKIVICTSWSKISQDDVLHGQVA